MMFQSQCVRIPLQNGRANIDWKIEKLSGYCLFYLIVLQKTDTVVRAVYIYTYIYMTCLLYVHIYMLYIYMCVHIHVYLINVYMYTCIHIYVCRCAYTYLHTCMYIHTYIYIYTRIRL